MDMGAPSGAPFFCKEAAIKISEAISLFNTNYDFLLAAKPDGKIVFASEEFCEEFALADSAVVGRSLNDIAADESHKNIHAATQAAAEGRKAWAVFVLKGAAHRPIYFRTGHLKADDGELFLFFCDRGDSGDYPDEWEKEKRVRELNCVYAVSDWIEYSTNIKDFFDELPKYLTPGMSYPDQAVVYAVYQGVEYGEKPSGPQFISISLEVREQYRGEMIVGYKDPALKFLPEEQKMLHEIGRVLRIALDRKDLRENLAALKDEAEEYTKRVADLQAEITSRTAEIEAQQSKLSTVNSYLSKMESGFEEAKIRLETMFKAVPDKVAIIDRNRKVILTNRENVPAGNKCHKTFFDSDVPCQDCRLARIIREKAPISIEIRHDDAYYQVHALPIFDSNQEVEGIIEFYREVTREKSYEEQLRQADKLASLGQLVSGIGHEINNPNQFIRGNIKIIQQAMDDMLPIVDEYAKSHPDFKVAKLKYEFFRQHIMTLINDMAHGSERIKGIVEGLKRFARRDEGLLIDSMEINTIIDAAARLVHNQVHKTSDIELELTPSIPSVVGNAQKIEQVLINLIMNASEAMPEGRRGHIVVSTKAEEGSVIIEVRDNGKGMNESTLKRMYEPFFTTRRAKGGTGLGLSIVYRIIEEHGGTVSVNSKVDVGTTFIITLPVRRRSGKFPTV
ncbi:MAG: ATP-binding protein [Candidatus Brocadiia bacterium]